MPNTDAITVTFNDLATNLADVVVADFPDGTVIDELGEHFSRTEMALFMARQVAYAIAPDDGSQDHRAQREAFLALFKDRVHAKATRVSPSFDVIDPWGDLPVDDD